MLRFFRASKKSLSKGNCTQGYNFGRWNTRSILLRVAGTSSGFEPTLHSSRLTQFTVDCEIVLAGAAVQRESYDMITSSSYVIMWSN